MTDQMADQWAKWRQEITEFMGPLATNADREDFIEDVDDVVYEPPLQLYTHVAMSGRSKTDGPYQKGVTGIKPIEKEFADRVVQFWMLYFLEEYTIAHAGRAIGHDEYLNMLNKFAQQDSMHLPFFVIRAVAIASEHQSKLQ